MSAQDNRYDPPGAPGYDWDVSSDAMRWRQPTVGMQWLIRCDTCNRDLIVVDLTRDMARALQTARNAGNTHSRLFPKHEVRGALFNDGEEYEATPPRRVRG